MRDFLLFTAIGWTIGCRFAFSYEVYDANQKQYFPVKFCSPITATASKLDQVQYIPCRGSNDLRTIEKGICSNQNNRCNAAVISEPHKKIDPMPNVVGGPFDKAKPAAFFGPASVLPTPDADSRQK